MMELPRTLDEITAMPAAQADLLRCRIHVQLPAA